MKAFTDIEQSKKLAEILPIESTDIYYSICADDEDNMFGDYDSLEIDNGYISHWVKQFTDKIDWNDSPCIPCWSLAALVEILPYSIGDYYIILGRTIDGCEWYVAYEYNEYFVNNIKYYKSANNLIDACVEMIYKLKEEDLL